MSSRTHHVLGLIKAVGTVKAAEILMRRALRQAAPVIVRCNGHAFEVRPLDSDLFVLSQIFGWQEYGVDADRLAGLRSTAAEWRAAGIEPLIIDAGANVGYSSVFFADLFPGVRVLAVEPDRTSFALLRRHASDNSAITAVYGALWSHNHGLELRSSDNGSWGSETIEGNGTPSQRLDDLISSIPNARALLIKLDIEGAEQQVIESCPEVFAAAKCILVEPHDFKTPGSACLQPLYRVAGRKRFDTILNGENLLLFALD